VRLPAKPIVHIKLIAPEKLVLVKGKGWRSGHPDRKEEPTDGGAPLLEGEEGEQQEGHVGDAGAFKGGDDDDVLQPGSPEAAMAEADRQAREQQEQEQTAGTPTKGKRARRGSLQAVK